MLALITDISFWNTDVIFLCLSGDRDGNSEVICVIIVTLA